MRLFPSARFQLLGCLLALVVAGPASHVHAQAKDSAGARGATAPETWHATAIVQGEVTGLRVIDYWSKGPNMVARTLIAGRPVTTLVAGGRYYVWNGLTGEGLDIARSPAAMAEDAGRDRPFGFELSEIRDAGGEKVEELRSNGRNIEIWQVRDGRGSRKLWVVADPPRVPVRQTTFFRASAETIELNYQNWIFDLELPDRFFAPPGGLALERFDYDGYVARAKEGPGGGLPILYPDLLHGTPPN